jgi:hypothetical protein
LSEMASSQTRAVVAPEMAVSRAPNMFPIDVSGS